MADIIDENLNNSIKPMDIKPTPVQMAHNINSEAATINKPYVLTHVQIHEYNEYIYTCDMPKKGKQDTKHVEKSSNNQSIGMLTAKTIQPNQTWPATTHVQSSNDTWDNHLPNSINLK